MKTTCKCLRPPGGGTECPPQNMAMCKTINGECHGSCIEVFEYGSTIEKLNYLLNIIKGVPEEEIQSLNLPISNRDLEILNSGTYKYVEDFKQVVVNFRLPEGLNPGGNNSQRVLSR